MVSVAERFWVQVACRRPRFELVIDDLVRILPLACIFTQNKWGKVRSFCAHRGQCQSPNLHQTSQWWGVENRHMLVHKTELWAKCDPFCNPNFGDSSKIRLEIHCGFQSPLFHIPAFALNKHGSKLKSPTGPTKTRWFSNHYPSGPSKGLCWSLSTWTLPLSLPFRRSLKIPTFGSPTGAAWLNTHACSRSPRFSPTLVPSLD